MTNTHNYVTTDKYNINLELEQDVIFLHSDVKDFSPSVLKEIQVHFDKICEVALTNNMSSVYSYTKNVKFCNSVSPCEVIGEIVVKGEKYDIIEWVI